MSDESPNGAASQAAREQELTDRVVASFDVTSSPRLREIMQSLVRHLHGFAREVRLTPEEWLAGIQFLTSVGQISDGRRQEGILLSDVLGLSMMTVVINDTAPGATPSTVTGPFFEEDAPHIPLGGDIAGDMPGSPCWLEGTVTDTSGAPIAGARVDLWEADDDGLYDSQRGDGIAGRGYVLTDDDGGYRLWSVKPAHYSVPVDGPVGEMLRVTGRRPFRPAHVHVLVRADGYHPVVTHAFLADSDHLDDDTVFGALAPLVVEFAPHSPGEGPGGRVLDETWYRARFDIALAPTG